MHRRLRRFIARTSMPALPILLGIALTPIVLAIPAWARKPVRSIATADGRPIRKVYIDANSFVTADSGTTQLTQDTCLTVVSKPSQADAVLELGMALPTLAGNTGAPDTIGSSSHPMGHAKKHPHQGVSATCSDGNQSGSCSSIYNETGPGIAPEQPADWRGNVGGTLDVVLVSAANDSRELWQPDAHTKRSWSDQLRVAAGCPVCPGARFNPRRDKTYRNWIQTTCPATLTVAAQ